MTRKYRYDKLDGKGDFMDWYQFGSCIAIFFGFFQWLRIDIKELGAKVDADMHAQTARTDQLHLMFIEEMKSQSARTDQLYQMFIDLLKERKNP